MNFSKYLIIFIILNFLPLKSSGSSNNVNFNFEKVSLNNSTPLFIGLGLNTINLYTTYNLNPLNINKIKNLNPNSLNSFDSWAVKKHSNTAKNWSDYLLYYHAIMPLILLAEIDNSDISYSYSYMYVEAQIVNLGLNIFTKNLATRNRPYAYNQTVPLTQKLTPDTRLSFYSGHTSFAFTSSVYTSKMFSELNINPDLNPVVWSINLLTASLTGYLRIEAGKHFPTDVIVGAIVGSTIGYFLPEIHRKNNNNSSNNNNNLNNSIEYIKPITLFSINYNI